MPGRNWNTAVVVADEQFAYWSDVVADAFCRVEMVRPDEGTFTGTVEATAVGPIGVATLVSQAQTVHRSAADVSRGAGDVFFLNLPLSGTSTVAQGGRVATIGAGDFAIVDAARPFELSFDDSFEQVSLTLPHDLLAPLLADPTGSTAVAVRGDRGLGAVASSTLAGLSRSAGSIDRGVSRPLAERVAGLVGLSLGAATSTNPGPLALTQLALDEVERSLADRALSPAVVAERIGISTRYLHRLFATRGESFGRHLLGRRLERCRRDLADPDLVELTVGEVAWRNGFADPSYLARAYRRRFGVSPGRDRVRPSA